MAVSDGRSMTPPATAEARPAHTATATRNTMPRRLRNILSLNDFEAVAKRYLPRSVFAFVQSGVENEVTLRDNREAFR